MGNRLVGRVVKITSFKFESTRAHDLCGNEPMWGVVTYTTERLPAGDLHVEIFGAKPEQEARLGNRLWVLDPDLDGWEVLRNRDVPDEVWAALAKWRLSQ